MNRNVESHFSELPQIDIERSIFDRSSTHKTSFNVVRLQTMFTPIMGNMYLDTYYFFVPNRIVWDALERVLR